MTNLEAAMARFQGEAAGRMPTTQGSRSSLPGNEGEPSRQPAAVRQAWLREMERTQLAGWFQPFAQTEAVPAPNTHAVPRAAASRLSAAAPRAVSSFPVAHRQLLQPRAGLYERQTHEALPNAAAKAAQQEPGGGEALRGEALGSAHSRASGMRENVEASPGRANRTAVPNSSHASAASDPQGFVKSRSEQDGWLKGSNVLDSAASPSDPLAHSPASKSHPVPAGSVLLIPTGITSSPMAGHPTLVADAMAAFAASDDPDAAVAAPLRPDGGVPRQQGAAFSASASRANARLPASEKQPAPGTRVHAQWSAAGVELWLGMDGTASQVGFQSAALVPSLQRSLREQGQRLMRVVCNGQVVFDCESPVSHQLPTTPRFADVVAAPPFAGLSRTDLFSSIFQKGNL
ncbi:hypothetical protein M4R22_19565 [Acidovorax sp. GBBC 3334]|uniref:hypothetical protein n=1 Tax=Acidovorax sp. GBBC 3334 TaxID=2940496 RepID=UPI0023042504|nr:hypothetical protein [Acidovorax sp. GBBC 3334]MDA8456962.1 hypothetical protein [Acidovorax sp. GBBC 3334]